MIDLTVVEIIAVLLLVCLVLFGIWYLYMSPKIRESDNNREEFEQISLELCSVNSALWLAQLAAKDQKWKIGNLECAAKDSAVELVRCKGEIAHLQEAKADSDYAHQEKIAGQQRVIEQQMRDMNFSNGAANEHKNEAEQLRNELAETHVKILTAIGQIDQINAQYAQNTADSEAALKSMDEARDKMHSVAAISLCINIMGAVSIAIAML